MNRGFVTLVPISESSISDNLSEDGMGVENVTEEFPSHENDVPDLEDNVDWSAVWAFQGLTLNDRPGEVATMDTADAEWIGPKVKLLNSGCTKHISPYKEDFTSLNTISPKPLQAANNQHFLATAQGKIMIQMPNSVGKSELQLHEVLYSLEVGYILVSISKLNDLGFDIHFHSGACVIHAPDSSQVAHIPKDKNSLYHIVYEEEEACTVKTISLNQFH
jgi:hypothetical protein